ncbi:hypothetical protein BSKO_02230 [Bryopsis sp. KO-2023]|nr:hypothetical protein BSKO_02230 [Bryopsis sp. KO-2023]
MGTMGGGLPYGLQAMLKEGYKLFSGVNEAVIKNIEACKELSTITKTSLGPHGMNKIIINHIDKLFVTSDCSTIVSELDVFHPAAKLVVLAAKAQQQEIGDGTNTVISFCGELLKLAEGLLKEGLHVAEVADGYEKATKKALETLESMVLADSAGLDVRDKEKVAKFLTASVSSKQCGNEYLLCPLIAEACVSICPTNPENFAVDNVRVCKILGGALSDSEVVRGMVIKRETEGTVNFVEDAKVAVYAQGVDTSGTETKGTVLIKSAEELENYASSEERRIEEQIKGISEAGTKVVVSGSAVGEMATHFLEKYGIMIIKITSKFELRRFCRSTGSTALATFRPPSQDELGYAKSISVKEIGGTSCIVLEQGEAKDGSIGDISTIVLRGSADAVLDDTEHAVDNAVNNYRILCKDSRALPGGGACEIELSRIISDFGKKQTGLDQYAIAKFAEALEVIPRALADTSGFDGTDIISALHAEHASGNTNAGVDVKTGTPKDMTGEGITDLYTTKWWALKLSADAVITVLKVDQIIMARAAGGPKPKQGGDWDED